MILSDIVTGIFSPIKDIVSEVVVDKDKRDQVNLQLAQLEDKAQERLDQLTQGQLDINKVEASSGSLFVAGWRPAVGWVGTAGLAYSTMAQPFGSWAARVIFHYNGDLPAIDNQLLLYILGGMLGLGTMRTVEKIKGVSTNDYTDTPGRTQPVQTNVEVAPSGQVTVDTKKGPAVTPAPIAKKHFHIF
jgi:hypothetical protein